ANLYRLQKREYPFWTLVTSGVEPSVGRGFNDWALVEVCEGFHCPSCGAFQSPMAVWEGAFGHAVEKALREWKDRSGPALLQSATCGKAAPITHWHCKPPLGFGNLSLRFWNWPPLDSPAWKLDIVGLVREVTGHTIVLTYGRF